MSKQAAILLTHPTMLNKREKDPMLFETDRVPFLITKDQKYGVAPNNYDVVKRPQRRYRELDNIKKIIDKHNLRDDPKGGPAPDNMDNIGPNSYQHVNMIYVPENKKIQPEISRLKRHGYATTSWYKQAVNEETTLSPGPSHYRNIRNFNTKIMPQINRSPKGLFPVTRMEIASERRKIEENMTPDPQSYQRNYMNYANAAPNLSINMADRRLYQVFSDTPGPGTYNYGSATRSCQSNRKIAPCFSRSMSSRFKLPRKKERKVWRNGRVVDLDVEEKRKLREIQSVQFNRHQDQ